jgi:LasA protease
MKYLSKGSVLNVVILMTALFFLFGCSGTKPATKPTPTEQPTTEKAKKEEPAAKPPSKPETVTPAKPPPPPPSPTPKVTPTPPLRITKVVWTAVNLRQGPGMNHKVIGTAKQGMTLGILEVKGDWLRVRLEDGNEAWVSKAATSEAPKAPPPPSSSPPPTTTTTKPITPSKPAPM